MNCQSPRTGMEKVCRCFPHLSTNLVIKSRRQGVCVRIQDPGRSIQPFDEQLQLGGNQKCIFQPGTYPEMPSKVVSVAGDSLEELQWKE